MPEEKLPPVAGSPFVTNNFGKFFFGICLAGLILAVFFVLCFVFLAKKHENQKTAAPKTSSSYSSGLGCQLAS